MSTSKHAVHRHRKLAKVANRSKVNRRSSKPEPPDTYITDRRSRHTCADDEEENSEQINNVRGKEITIMLLFVLVNWKFWDKISFVRSNKSAVLCRITLSKYLRTRPILHVVSLFAR